MTSSAAERCRDARRLYEVPVYGDQGQALEKKATTSSIPMSDVSC